MDNEEDKCEACGKPGLRFTDNETSEPEEHILCDECMKKYIEES